ncbi:MAG: 3,4-dihydroxy-2-butanone-4-phosphate synthase [Microbacteriaceae bacterium]
MSLASIPEALEALRRGRPVIVADDESRENEGDVIISAELATRETVAWMVRLTSGFICAPMTDEIADRLELPVMVSANEDPRGTNYTISVDSAEQVSTGISASDRAHTLRVLADLGSRPADLRRPGHILPLRAVPGGVRERAGHTEAAVDLMKLAGLSPVGAIGEIVDDDGEMMRLPQLLALGERDGVPVITIEELIRHLDAEHPGESTSRALAVPESPRVDFEVETTVPTAHGVFRVRAYRDRQTGADHLAIIAGEPRDGALVRLHSECLTGEALGSLKCECGPQLEAALERIRAEGGVVVYLRGHEGRGIGLINKLRAYRLQEDGLDTLEANLALGLPVDGREYGAAVAILRELGLGSVRALTNNPEKIRQLVERGMTVTEQVPLIVGAGAANERYLSTKRDRMGHLLPGTGPAAARGVAGGASQTIEMAEPATASESTKEHQA